MIRIAAQSDIADIARLNDAAQRMHAKHAPALFRQPTNDAAFIAWFEKAIREPTVFSDEFALNDCSLGQFIAFLHSQSCVFFCGKSGLPKGPCRTSLGRRGLLVVHGFLIALIMPPMGPVQFGKD